MAAELPAPRQHSYPRRDLAVLVGDGSRRASTLSGGIPFESAEDSTTYERLSSPGPKRLALKVKQLLVQTCQIVHIGQIVP